MSGDLHAELQARGLMRGFELDRDTVRAALAELDAGPVVTFLLEKAARSGDPMGVGPHADIVDAILEAPAFEPDVDGLFAVYRVVEDSPATAILIEWLLGRSGPEALVERLAPFLAAEDERDRLLAAQLIRRAGEASGMERPDFGGAGGDVRMAEPPDDEVLIDDHLAEGNGDSEPHATPPDGRGERGFDLPEAVPEDEPETQPETANGGEGPGEPAVRNGHDDDEAPDEDEAPATDETQSRWVLARIDDPGTPADAEPLRAFRAMAPNEVTVTIDVPREGFLAAVGPNAAASVDAALPEGVTHELTVMFQVPALLEAQTRTIRLPPSGPSDEARFTFTAPPAGQRVDATITVLHGNRALQAAVLSGSCFEDPTGVPPGFEASLRFAVIRPGTAGVEDRRPFDAAVVAGGSERGPAAAGVTGDAAVPFDDDLLGPVVDRVRTLLRRLSDDAPSFAGGLRSDASVGLLRALAFQGRDLHDLIAVPIQRARGGEPPERIQVVVTGTEAFVPVEFIYDLPTPTADAGLCPNAEQALADGRCDDRHHPAGPLPGTVTVVCPLGFWALRKVIERQVVEPEGEEALRGKDFAIRSEVTPDRPALGALTGAVVAWSDRVNLSVPGQSDAVEAALLEVTGRPAAAVRTWEDWVTAVANDAPSLLVLLSHTVTEQGTPALEIGPDGAGSRCLRVALVQEFVKRDAEARPVVLLLGCDTAVGRAEPQTFVSRFRDVGAALVVGTVAPVLGENAAPVATALVRELRAAAPGAGQAATFGEAMLRVRRKLLAAGHLTSLCVTSVGDADWQLAPAGDGG